MGKKVLAFDFGASSGRAVLGDFDGEKLTLTELHRFSNDPVMMRGTFYWDFLRLFYEIKAGINKTVHGGHADIASIGIDTWGVDFGLLDEAGRLLENPVHYRDTRTEGIMDEVFGAVPRDELYRRTGIQFMNFNTLFQLYYLATRRPELLAKAKKMLFMPDLMGYFLTGSHVTEYTDASTSQMLDPWKRNWDRDLLKKLRIPTGMLGEIVQPGTKVGVLTKEIREELGAPAIDVVAVAGHDTGSAVAAVPAAAGENSAYLSCGTWSLLGVEADEPIVTDASLAYNYTNEGGYNGKIRFLKNIIGLWLMQECRRDWNAKGEKLSFADIDKYTAETPSLQRFIDPDDPPFNAPGNMPGKIVDFCRRTGQSVPEGKGEFARMIADSLSLKYRRTVEELERLRGRKIDLLRIIGGGVKDRFVCQCTANALNRPVMAGPVEATALGNIAVQLIACGEFADLSEAREAIARSFPVKTYEPQDAALWDDAYGKYCAILEKAKQ